MSAGSGQPPPVVGIAQIWRSACTAGRLCRVRLPLPGGGEARGLSRRSCAPRPEQKAARTRSRLLLLPVVAHAPDRALADRASVSALIDRCCFDSCRSRGSCSDRCTRRLGLPPPAGSSTSRSSPSRRSRWRSKAAISLGASRLPLRPGPLARSCGNRTSRARARQPTLLGKVLPCLPRVGEHNVDGCPRTPKRAKAGRPAGRPPRAARTPA
jgi:hypothetical protein